MFSVHSSKGNKIAPIRLYKYLVLILNVETEKVGKSALAIVIVAAVTTVAAVVAIANVATMIAIVTVTAVRAVSAIVTVAAVGAVNAIVAVAAVRTVVAIEADSVRGIYSACCV